MVFIAILSKNLETTNEKLDAQNYQMQYQRTQLEYLNNNEAAIKDAIVDLKNDDVVVETRSFTSMRFKWQTAPTEQDVECSNGTVTIYKNGFVLIYGKPSVSAETAHFYIPLANVYYIQYD